MNPTQDTPPHGPTGSAGSTPGLTGASVLRAEPGQYLSFGLSGEGYAVPILSVREIIEHTPTTRVPSLPAWVLGVINLRGEVVPIVDLVQRISSVEGTVTARTCFVIVESPHSPQTLFGMQVDSVTEVIELGADQLEPTPSFGTQLSSEHLLGLARRDEDLLLLLDAQGLFAMPNEEPREPVTPPATANLTASDFPAANAADAPASTDS